MKMKGSEEFKKTCPLAWKNISNDSELTEEKRIEFITHLDAYAGGDIKEHAKDFFHNNENTFLGTEIYLDADEVLGRLIGEDALAYHLTIILNITINESKNLIQYWVEVLDKDSQLEDINEKVGEKELSPHIMWSFRNLTNKLDPFDNNIDLDDMPCVLGLRGKNPPFICIVHKLPDSIKTHYPTAFNAGIDSASYAWEPGGKTIPLSWCSDKYSEGLPEIVHEPSDFKHLQTPITKLG